MLSPELRERFFEAGERIFLLKVVITYPVGRGRHRCHGRSRRLARASATRSATTNRPFSPRWLGAHRGRPEFGQDLPEPLGEMAMMTR